MSFQAGKEPIDQGILHQKEQSQDQQTNTPGPTCQHTRTNTPTNQDQHANTQGPAKINKARIYKQTQQDQHANTPGPTKIKRKEDQNIE